MSDQITVTNPDSTTELFTVFYSAETRQKRIRWDSGGTGNGFANINKLYSALQDLFDEPGQLDDGVPMSAQTPTEYTIGIIDSGDSDPWFIDRVSVEHLTGGALRTSSWERDLPGDGTGNTGIVRISYALSGGFTTDFITSDIGKTVVSANGDTGTLLDFNTTLSTKVAWIRPTNNALANDWDSASGEITVTGGTGDVNQASAGVTGESLWANIFTIGTIEPNTHIYANQNALSGGEEGELLVGYKSTTDWWADGHIDVVVNVTEVGIEIDEAVLQVFARQHSKTYDHFELTDLSSGGRNPVPLSTGNDLDNQIGYRQLLTDAETGGGWDADDVGTVITGTVDATEKAVLTSVSGTGPNYTMQYYLIGDPQNDFEDNDVFRDPASTKTATVVGSPTDVNPSTWTDVTVTFGADETFDIDEDDTTEDYSIVVDCGSRADLQEVYQRLKYITRRGDTSDILGGLGVLQGQFYVGEDRRIFYSNQDVGENFTEGSLVTGNTTGASGIIVADHPTDVNSGYIIVRNTRMGGTGNNVDFSAAETVTSGTVNADVDSVTTITTPKAAPFGTFAGGKFFGASGVVLDNVPSADASNYQLIDDTGAVVVPPTKVAVAVTNTRQDDKVAVFRLASGEIEKNYYSINADAAIGATSIVVTPSIRIDEPGKAAGGVLRIVDVSDEQEYRLRFDSWTGSTFNLFEFDANPAAAGTTTTNITFTGIGTYAKVGDLVINHTQGEAVSYVVDIPGANDVTIFPAITGQTTGDDIELNVVPVALEDGTPGPADTLYVPFIDVFETTGADPSGGTEEATITFNATVPVRVRARHADVPANYGIVPYSADTNITSTGMTNSIIRTPDTIFTA